MRNDSTWREYAAKHGHCPYCEEMQQFRRTAINAVARFFDLPDRAITFGWGGREETIDTNKYVLLDLIVEKMNRCLVCGTAFQEAMDVAKRGG